MMIVRRSVVLLALWIHNTAASPAVVWTARNKQIAATVHSSIELPAQDVLGDFLSAGGASSEASSSRVTAVVFLLSRGDDGSESLSALASQGELPLVAREYETASVIHHNVQGLDLAGKQLLAGGARTGSQVLDISLGEFSKKLEMMDETSSRAEVGSLGSVMSVPAAEASASGAGKRSRALANSNVFVVKVDVSATTPSEIDHAVFQAIHHAKVDTVILAGVRSVDEVKGERQQYYQRKLQLMDTVSRKLLGSSSRRLEENQGDDANKGNNQDLTGVYYVNMTPNILAGLLFTFLFTFVTLIAVSCMGMISGQDTYVSKYPSIGREA
jgi:hypothetical protein